MITKNQAAALTRTDGTIGFCARALAHTSHSRFLKTIRCAIFTTMVVLLPLSIPALSPAAHASVAWGSINNFDTVNDTGGVCHGFEIEIDGIHSRDITYTYDWNHYGVPKITEDVDPLGNPRVFVRYESAKNPDGSWAAFTSVPAVPIQPTDGHQFTNPGVNFGGEHFGVGFYGAPAAIKYSWLKDDGFGHLVFAGAVNIATPTFVYFPPPAPALPAQVQAAIQPPPPPDPPVKEFGVASWVKVTTTQTHNNNKVELRDLVSDDPDDPNDRNWKNGEPDEVEVEWQILQTEFNKPGGGANGEMEGAPEDLNNGDEVITRRYDFFKYVGPTDPETGEALADSVGPDGIHGVGDYADVVVVGDYVGAQMAGFDAAAQIGLIDHLQDGELNLPYVERSIVIGGTAPILTTRTGALPDGMTFDEISGILSGTPTVAGTFTFVIHSIDFAGGDVSTTYHLTILDGAIVEPPHITVTTIPSPAVGGTTTGGGEFVVDTNVIVGATANPGFAFVSWTDGGTIVSTSPSYEFPAHVNIELVANFVHTYDVTTSASPVAGGTTSGGGNYNDGDSVTVTAVANPGYFFVNWTEGADVVSSSADYTFAVGANRALVANFVTDITPPTTTAALSGTLGSNGWYRSGVQVTLSATDDISGVAHTYYQVDGGAQQTYAGPFTVSGDGNHTVTFWSVDNTGNVETAQEQAINIDTTAPALTASANPSVIWPANGGMVNVTISGKISDSLSGVDTGSGSYATVDSHGKVQPAGSFTIAADGTYTFTVRLEASRLGQDRNGRTYTFTLHAKDLAGNAGSTTVVVTVPHDQR